MFLFAAPGPAPSSSPLLALCPRIDFTLRTASLASLCWFLVGFSQCEALVDIRDFRREKLYVYSSDGHWTAPPPPLFPKDNNGFLSTLPSLLAPLTLSTPLQMSTPVTSLKMLRVLARILSDIYSFSNIGCSLYGFELSNCSLSILCL